MPTFPGFEHIVREQEPLAPHTWFRLGGPAEYFAEPTRLEELTELLAHCHQANLSVRLLGGGSRVLVPDEGVSGLVIQLSAPAFSTIEVNAPTIRVGGGAKLGHLVSAAVGAGLAGLENLVGIPGSVAGALRGNAHNQGSSIGQWITSARLINREGKTLDRQRDEMRFSYGESSLHELVILEATFELEPGNVGDLTRRMQKSWIVRKSSEPSSHNGIGRIFKDAQGMTAAELIEQAGLRGESVGQARVSDTCANFIQVGPGATASDVGQLVETMRNKVASALGISLECELEIW
jgi:UDP-N-acetylmuramate dehydrogenase